MKDKPFVSRCSSISDALAAVGKLASIVTEAMKNWGEIEIIVRKFEPKRSLDQNRLQRLWCKQAAAQGDMDAEEYRGYCKYHFGIAILCRDDEEYRRSCKQVLGNLSYEQRLLLMQEPHDYPVTRGMTKRQKQEYLDKCWEHFTSLGFRLTDPSTRGIDAQQYKEAA